MKCLHLKSLIFILIITFLQGKSAFSTEKIRITDTLLVYSVQKCTEHIFQTSHQNHYHGKPIYWAKVISINFDKNEWEVVFTETDRQKTFMVADFKFDTIIDNGLYLLLIDYDNMFRLPMERSKIKLDSLVFTEEYVETEYTNLHILTINTIYCRIKYHKNRGFSVFCKWWYLYEKIPGKQRVFQYVKLNKELGFLHEKPLIKRSEKFSKFHKKMQRHNKRHAISHETEKYKFE